MLKLYTCYKCCFPFKADDRNLPPRCPACNCGPEWFLGEPYNPEEKRRIHVDPPEPEEGERDVFDISYHVAKRFPAGTRNGRLRRFVFEYTDAQRARRDYAELLDWDIVDCEGTDAAHPEMFCATGPGNPNWEPSVPSFIYGFLKDAGTDPTGMAPFFMIEVDNIEQTAARAERFGGRVLRGRYEANGQQYAALADSEGNAFYIWETPATVTWDEPESQGG